MPFQLRKTWKHRGNVSQGLIVKHRKHQAGQGNVGGGRHHRVNFNDYHQSYFGKASMSHYHWKRNQSICPTAKLNKLWPSVSKEMQVNAAKTKTGAAPITEVVWSGYCRVLGERWLPKQPVLMKVTFLSRRAEKIRGVCLCGGEDALWPSSSKPHGGRFIKW